MEARSTTGSTEFNVNSVLERTFGTAKARPSWTACGPSYRMRWLIPKLPSTT